MTWTRFYCRDESKIMQEGFFQIPFLHLLSAPSSSSLARYKTENWKSERPPYSLLIAVFALFSVHIFLSGSKGIQNSTLNIVLKSVHHFCALAHRQVGNVGVVPCSKTLATSADFQGSDSPWGLSVVSSDLDIRALYTKQGSVQYGTNCRMAERSAVKIPSVECSKSNPLCKMSVIVKFRHCERNIF